MGDVAPFARRVSPWRVVRLQSSGIRALCEARCVLSMDLAGSGVLGGPLLANVAVVQCRDVQAAADLYAHCGRLRRPASAGGVARGRSGLSCVDWRAVSTARSGTVGAGAVVRGGGASWQELV